MASRATFAIPEGDAVHIVFSNIRGPANGAIALGNFFYLSRFLRAHHTHGESQSGGKDGDLFSPNFLKLLSKCLLTDITFKPMPSITYRLL